MTRMSHGLALLLGIVLVLCPSVLGQGETKAATGSAWGLCTSTFDTPFGQIVVNLPDDMAATDTISGSVIAKPKGESDDEIRRNTDQLNGYVVAVEEKETRVDAKRIRWEIPAALTTGIARLVLKDKNGAEIAGTDVPVQREPPPIVRPNQPLPGDFELPIVGTAGRPVEIIGPFDGDFANTAVKVGGDVTQILAESPRKVIAQSPSAITGPTEIAVSEGPVTATGAYNNISVALSAGKTTLLEGERTTVTTKVAGLRDLSEDAFPLSVTVINASPSVVRFTGETGSILTETVNADDVEPGGTYTLATPVTGIREGAFQMLTTVRARTEPRDLRLMSPRDNADAHQQGTWFEWFVTRQVPNAAYDLRIWEMATGQTEAQATMQAPRFERKGLATASFQYTANEPPLDPGKTYCWQVDASVAGYAVLTSDVWAFMCVAGRVCGGSGKACQKWQCPKCGKIWECSSNKCPQEGCGGSGRACQKWQCPKCGKIWECSSNKCPEAGCGGSGRACQKWQCPKCKKIWECSSNKCPEEGCGGSGRACQKYQCPKCGKIWECSSNRCPSEGCKGSGRECQKWQCQECGHIWECSSNKCPKELPPEQPR